jgi:hypothetical protein
MEDDTTAGHKPTTWLLLQSYDSMRVASIFELAN